MYWAKSTLLVVFADPPLKFEKTTVASCSPRSGRRHGRIPTSLVSAYSAWRRFDISSKVNLLRGPAALSSPPFVRAITSRRFIPNNAAISCEENVRRRLRLSGAFSTSIATRCAERKTSAMRRYVPTGSGSVSAMKLSPSRFANPTRHGRLPDSVGLDASNLEEVVPWGDRKVRKLDASKCGSRPRADGLWPAMDITLAKASSAWSISHLTMVIQRPDVFGQGNACVCNRQFCAGKRL